MMDRYIRDTLEKLCCVPGVGTQSQIAQVAETMLQAYTVDVVSDAAGNLIATVQSKFENAPVIALEAHMDEIGFVVTDIHETGFLKVSPCGGVDIRVLPAAVVTVWVDQPLVGVFCSTPPHLRDKIDQTLDTDNLWIDIGLSADEVKKRVKIGCWVSFASNFADVHAHCVTSKALDNRAGMTAILYALHLLRDKALPYTVKVLFAKGEELGNRGATSGAFLVDADAALITDVSFAYTPNTPKEACGKMGEGVMIGISPILSENLTDQMLSIAKSEEIPFQLEVLGGKTGTDADVITTARCGIPSVLLSVPLKYMHTPIEVVDVRDIAAVGRCMAAFIEKGVLEA